MIQAKNLTKRFDSFTALENISCEINRGMIYGLVGSNGAGKSTLIRALTGVYRADGGKVTLDGEEIFDNPRAKEKIAYVPDELFFLPNATMHRMSLLYAALFPRFSRDRYSELAARFGMQIVASGGVSSMEDVEKLTALDLYGAIVGKAYYTGAIDLTKAIEVAKK